MEAVLKVGGSLSQGQGLVKLCNEIGRLGKRHALLVIPGGAGFADQARAYDRRYGLNETTAHRMAILGMDQYGLLLGDLIPGSRLVTDFELAERTARDGGVPVLLPSWLVGQMDPLPHSWEVTSDSIAAWIAVRLEASTLILLKSVDGIFSRSPSGAEAELLTLMTIDDLSKGWDEVDEYLYKVLRELELETWVINGRNPDRLAELMKSGHTSGTRISQAA